MNPFATLLIVSLFAVTVQGANLVENFTSRQIIESSTLVFNQELQSLHPTLLVEGYDNGNQSQDFNVGDGRHGAFNLSTYSSFDQNGDVSGNLIQINTDEYPTLHVTSFLLEEGWTLEAVGSGPLVIQSLTDITINGLILCRGEDGQDAIGAQPGFGGLGRCGGGRGGNGGVVSADGERGISPSATITGGQGGNFTGGAAVGGGGGGSWNQTTSPGNGSNASINGGQAGLSVSDPDFTFTNGSAGGGGGSGTVTDAGGGGGAGGGTVLLSAVRNISVGPLGEIDANGGNGGNSNLQGGPGGGGAGGSIRVFAGSEIQLLNLGVLGAAHAEIGSGGTNALFVAPANGGPGRNWFAAVTYDLAGFYTPSEEIGFTPGDVTFSSQTQELITQSYDLRSTNWLFQSISPLNSDLVVQVAGSADNFESDDSGWVSDPQQIAGKRYLKLKIQMTNSLGNQPIFLEQLSFDYSPRNQTDFEFEAAGCGRVNISGPPKGSWPIPLLFLPMLLLLGLKLKARQDTAIIGS